MQHLNALLAKQVNLKLCDGSDHLITTCREQLEKLKKRLDLIEDADMAEKRRFVERDRCCSNGKGVLDLKLFDPCKDLRA